MKKKKVKITDADVAAVASRVKEIAPDLPNSDDPVFYSHSPAVKVINSVLSLGINYEKVVRPRLRTFRENNPDVGQVSELAAFIACYPTPIDFLTQELNYRHKPKNIMKANAIHSVVNYLGGIIKESPAVSEEEVLEQWAIQAKPEDYRSLGIKGFKLAGFQWLRMLFGADTTKPDVHIKRFLRDALNREVSGTDSIELMEAVAADLKVSVRAVDRIIWNIGAGNDT